MAGDWMQLDCDLPEKPEVQGICDLTGEPVDVVVGRMFLFWRWVERHAVAQVLRSCSLKTVARVAGGDDAFWNAVIQVGWLAVDGADLVIPGWEKRFSKSSKQRHLAAKRMAKSRVTQKLRSSATGASPKEEKSKSNTSLGVPKEERQAKRKQAVSVSEVQIPKELDTPEVRSALDEWLAYKRKRRESYQDAASVLKLLQQYVRAGPALFVSAVNHSIAQNYAGCYAPGKGNHDGKQLTAGQRYDPSASGDI